MMVNLIILIMAMITFMTIVMINDDDDNYDH